MTDADVAGPTERWGEAVERQLERLGALLVAEFGGDLIAARTVREHLAVVRENYAGARVWAYLPILIEREVRHRLRNQMPPANEQRQNADRRPSRATGTPSVARPRVSVIRAASIGTGPESVRPGPDVCTSALHEHPRRL